MPTAACAPAPTTRGENPAPAPEPGGRGSGSSLGITRSTLLAVADPNDLRPDPAELLLDPLVPAVDVGDAADLGLAVRDEPGQDERRAGPDVRGADAGAGEPVDPADDRMMTFGV